MDLIKEEENNIVFENQVVDTSKLAHINAIKIKIFDLNEVIIFNQQQIINLRQELIRLQQQ